MEKEIQFRDNCNNMKANPLPLTLLSDTSIIYTILVGEHF